MFSALIAAYFLPESLQTASFLTEEERLVAGELFIDTASRLLLKGFIFPVERFLKDDKSRKQEPYVVSSPPQASDEKEKGDIEHVNTIVQPEEVIPEPEEEQFEWREVVRGTQQPLQAVSAVMSYAMRASSWSTKKQMLITFKLFSGLKDIQTWTTGIGYFGLLVSLYSYSLFLCVTLTFHYEDILIRWKLLILLYRPTIVAGLGYTGTQAQLHTGNCSTCRRPFKGDSTNFTVQFHHMSQPLFSRVSYCSSSKRISKACSGSTVVVALLSDRLKWRGPFILICLPFAIIGEFSLNSMKPRSFCLIIYS